MNPGDCFIFSHKGNETLYTMEEVLRPQIEEKEAVVQLLNPATGKRAYVGEGWLMGRRESIPGATWRAR